MNKTRTLQRAAACVTAAALLAGCATTKGPTGGQQSDQGSDPCSTMASAVAGALVGAMLGGIVDGKRGAARGAAAGAGVAALACVAINFNSRQTKTAAQADQDYLRTGNALPPEPEVTAYAAQLQAETVQRGQPLKVSSTLELINGTHRKVTEVREELVVSSPDGTPFKTGSKPFTAGSAGRFENNFELKLPSNAPQGAYALKTNVYVNGKLLASRDLRTQVVFDGDQPVLVAIR